MSVQQEAPPELWGGETRKAVENFPVSGERVPVAVVRWLGRIKGAAARANADLGLLDADLAQRIARRGRRDRAGPPRRPVPDRRLPDRLGHVVEHERQRGHRHAGRRGRAPQRPRQHGPVLQRRVPERRPPGRAGGGDAPAAARARAPRDVAREEGRRVQGHRQVRPHAPDGRRARDARPGVRRLRRAGPPRRAARAQRAAAGRADPARRHGDRHGPQHAPGVRRARARPPERRDRAGHPAARGSVRGAGQPRRARRAVGRAEGRRRLADQDRQRHRAARLRPARRHRRDLPARAAEGLLDHAGQGQPGDAGGRAAGLARR